MSGTRSYDARRKRARLFNVWLTTQQYEHLAALSRDRGSSMSDTVRAGIAALHKQAERENAAA